MTKTDIVNVLISEHVTDLVDRANKSEGHRSDYLACISGMWADTLKYKTAVPLKSDRLKCWYLSGERASRDTREAKLK